MHRYKVVGDQVPLHMANREALDIDLIDMSGLGFMERQIASGRPVEPPKVEERGQVAETFSALKGDGSPAEPRPLHELNRESRAIGYRIRFGIPMPARRKPGPEPEPAPLAREHRGPQRLSAIQKRAMRPERPHVPDNAPLHELNARARRSH